MPFFAHSGISEDKSDWQPLHEHLQASGRLASAYAQSFGLDKAAYIAGLLHDLGKYDPAFQRRLEGAPERVDHSTAGAKILLELAKGEDAYMAELIAYGILGHHAGLPDKNSADARNFDRRIGGYEDRLDPSWKEELTVEPTGLLPGPMAQKLAERKAHVPFNLSVVARFLFSCLVDADFKDTERFYATLEGRAPERAWPDLTSLLPELIERFDTYMADRPSEGDLNRLRREILAHLRGKAAMKPGLFTLTVPTGGGKTLASLGFALDHARIHGHRRIIYAIPFTSIVDQTADVFRQVLGDDHILEHHSAIDEERPDIKKRPTSRDRLKLAMEDWAAPVVVTTNVQLFESLFSARPSRARKLHNIAGSIIILDEAQTIPRPLLRPCIRMLDALAHLFDCTIVLCTATQPALGLPDFPDGLEFGEREGERELAPDPTELTRRLQRARIALVGEMDNRSLIAAVRNEPQSLVIVNSRKHALELYRETLEEGLCGLVHMTTRQCAAHRRAILKDVRARLRANEPCRLVATSLVEAGVDVDFPRVWRAMAGLDSIVQASGRCNREGKRPLAESVVSVFSPTDYEPPREIAGLIGDLGRMVSEHDNLLSLEAIKAYFGEVYWRLGGQLDGKGILDGLRAGPSGTDFAFRSIAEKFHMIESRMEPVIIPFDERAQKAVDDLGVAEIPSGVIARAVQSYVVNVPPQAREILIRCGHVEFERPDLRGDQFAVLRTKALYKDDSGLLWEDAEYLSAESSVI